MANISKPFTGICGALMRLVSVAMPAEQVAAEPIWNYETLLSCKAIFRVSCGRVGKSHECSDLQDPWLFTLNMREKTYSSVRGSDVSRKIIAMNNLEEYHSTSIILDNRMIILLHATTFNHQPAYVGSTMYTFHNLNDDKMMADASLDMAEIRCIPD